MTLGTVPNEAERRSTTEKERVLLRVMTSDENLIHFDNPKHRKSEVSPAIHQHRQQRQMSIVTRFCSTFGGISSM